MNDDDAQCFQTSVSESSISPLSTVEFTIVAYVSERRPKRGQHSSEKCTTHLLLTPSQPLALGFM
jgi:ABC-type Fe3+ transport system permease subunit